MTILANAKIKLTDKQIEILKPLRDVLLAERDHGRLAICIGQTDFKFKPCEMRLVVFPHSIGAELVRITSPKAYREQVAMGLIDSQPEY